MLFVSTFAECVSSTDMLSFKPILIAHITPFLAEIKIQKKNSSELSHHYFSEYCCVMIPILSAAVFETFRLNNRNRFQSVFAHLNALICFSFSRAQVRTEIHIKYNHRMLMFLLQYSIARMQVYLKSVLLHPFGRLVPSITIR